MTLLQAMLDDDTGGRGSDAVALSALADCIWVLLVIAATQGGSSHHDVPRYGEAPRPDADPVWNAVRSLLPEASLPEPAIAQAPGTSGSVFTWPHLALAVQLTGASTTGMALILDDSDEALESPVHEDSWRMWIRLSNVLALSQATVTITTTSQALDELNSRSRTEETATPREARAMSELGWDAVDRELTPPAVLELLPHLAAAGIAYEADGVELADGVMTDLSWQRARVAVIADPPQADAATLAAAGWHVVGMGDNDPDSPAELAARIASLLKGQ